MLEKKLIKKAIIVVAALILLEGIYILSHNRIRVITSRLSLNDYANQIVRKCASSPYHPSCYDKEIPKLMFSPANLSMEQSFQVTSLIQDQDKSYAYCHVLGHTLSAQEVDKDPSKWEDVVARCPAGLCSNGCIHGGFQERFRTDHFDSDSQVQAILPDLKSICEDSPRWHPTGLEQASCYHALGHLAMYISNGEITKAINICNQIALKPDGRDFRHLCYDGNFMQIFQPLEPEDIALVKGKQPTAQTINNYCNNFDGMMRGSCISESWPLFKNDLQNPSFVEQFCSKEMSDERSRCLSSMFYILTVEFNFDIPTISKFCSGFKGTDSNLCFANAASRMIETDYRNINLAVNLCQNTGSDQTKSACFDELLKYSSYNYQPNSKDQINVCNSLINPWKQKCLMGESS